MSITKPFEYFAHINKTTSKPDDPEAGKHWVGYLAEQYYANYYDTVLLAELSSMMNIPETAKEQFFRAVVPKGKKKFFWPKGPKQEDLELIAEFCDISMDKAIEIEKFVPNSVISKMKQQKEMKNEGK